MGHLLPCRLHLRSRVSTLPAIKDVETETIPRNRAPIGSRNNLRARQPLLRHDSHSPMACQLRRSGRPGTITGQHRASPSPGRQHRNGRKHRLRTAIQALDMPRFQRRNPSRLRRTRRARASRRTTNTRQLVESKWGSVQESDRARDFSGVRVTAKTRAVAVVAVGMWKPAFGAGFQAPWDRQQLFAKKLRRRSHGASFPQQTCNPAHFRANVVAGCC
jgi:hypothetical protein